MSYYLHLVNSSTSLFSQTTSPNYILPSHSFMEFISYLTTLRNKLLLATSFCNGTLSYIILASQLLCMFVLCMLIFVVQLQLDTQILVQVAICFVSYVYNCYVSHESFSLTSALMLKHLAFGVAGFNLQFLIFIYMFNPYAPSNWINLQLYHQHEEAKHCQNEEHVDEIEHGDFSPLVFSTSGGM